MKLKEIMGLSSALCLGASLNTGAQAIAGEWGHMSIDPQGQVYYCGKKGCVETFISGGGLENRYAEKFGVRKSLKDVEAAYYAGEPQAGDFMQEFFDCFGRALANLIDILDPDMVVIGGGVSNFKAVYSEGVAAVRRYVFTDELETPIVKNQLGDSAGVFGAALVGV
jgi:fructokinase